MFTPQSSEFKRGLMPWHLVGLWGLAVAQPIYEMLARFPAFLSAHDMRAGRVLAFCVLLSAVLPGEGPCG